MQGLGLTRMQTSIGMQFRTDKVHGTSLVFHSTLDQVQLQQVSRPVRVLQPLLRTNRLETALCHNGNAITQGIGLNHHVSRNDNGTLLRGKALDQIPNVVSRGWIQT